ncbi:MAG: phosphatidate cytidylyltransferase [Synergistaceae bacterium]|nr:phosphatidate cytidylyltransferase [Synergistaceae bacterium]
MKPEKNKELATRTMSSAVIAPVILFAVHYGEWVWPVVAGVIALLSLSEYYELISRLKGAKISPGVGYIFSIIFFLVARQDTAQSIILAMILSLCVFSVFCVEVVKRQISKGISNAVFNAGGIISGVLYIAIPWTCLIMLRDYVIGRQILMTIFLCTWGCDVGAYLGGKKFGTVKLCEYVSPGKTVQGFIFGFLGAMIVNIASIYFFILPVYPIIIIGFICGVAGQLGDLVESLIKRETGQKDSGRLIPGHGGMLDRFDSILFNGLLSYLALRVLI